jgi:hypothetical protein
MNGRRYTGRLRMGTRQWSVQLTSTGPFGCWTHWADVRLLLKHMEDVDATDDDG